MMANKSKTGFGRIISIFEDHLNSIGTIAWLLIVFITFLDVVMRYLFASPLPGGYELIKTLMVVGIFISLPSAALRHANVRVELLVQMLPVRLQSVSLVAGSLSGFIFFGFITWRLYFLTLHSIESGEYTTYLRLPLWWIMFIMVILGIITTGCCIISAFVAIRTDGTTNRK